MYTYDQLMQMAQAERARLAGQPQTAWGGSGMDSFQYTMNPGDAGYVDYNDPNSPLTWNNGLTGNEGVSYAFNPTNNLFDITQGDATSGFQRWSASPSGTTDLGFEAYDRNGKYNTNLGKMAAIAAGVTGAGAAANGGLGGLFGSGGTGAGTGATASTLGSTAMDTAGLDALIAQQSAMYPGVATGAAGAGAAAAAPSLGDLIDQSGLPANSGYDDYVQDDNLFRTQDGRVGADGVYRTGAEIGAQPGDMDPRFTTPDGGIDWGKLSQAAASGFDISKILPGLLGAAAGAAGSGPMTSTSTASETINDPAYQKYRDDTFNTLRNAANQGYGAPNFSLTQGDRPEQGQATGYFGDFASGARDVQSQVNPLAAENNPFITNAISAGARDMADAYARLVAPTYAGASSFGNRNMGEYENADRSNFMMRVSDLSNSMRMQDHNLRAQLLESGAGRADAMGNANANRSLGAANSLFGAGSTLWGQGQTNLQNQYAEFLRGQNWQREGAKLMTPGLNAPFNATRTSSQTTPGNRAAGALGGFTVGMQAGNLFNGMNGNQRTTRTVGGAWG